MKMKMKISDKDAKLLFILCTLIIIAGAWFLFYSPNMKKAEAITANNETLQNRVNDLSALEARKPEKEQEMKILSEKSAEIISGFSAGMTEEKVIDILNTLEETGNMVITSENFTENTLFYPDPAQIAAQAAAAQAEAAAAQAAAQGTEEAAAEAVPAETPAPAPSAALMGYRMPVTISFRTTYEGLKKSVDFLLGYPGKIELTMASIAYDTSTGELSGSMSFSFYSLLSENGETDRIYTAPVIEGVTTGVANIFGTMAAPVKNTVPKPKGN